jgi:hypothetical protein
MMRRIRAVVEIAAIGSFLCPGFALHSVQSGAGPQSTGSAESTRDLAVETVRDTVSIDLSDAWYPFLGIGWNVHPAMFQYGNWDSIRFLLDESNMQFARIIGHMEWWHPDSHLFTPTSSAMNSIYGFLDYCEEANVVVMFHNWWTGGKYDEFAAWPNHYWWLANCCHLDPANSLNKWKMDLGWTISGPETDHPYDPDSFASSICKIIDYMVDTRRYSCIRFLGIWNEPNGLWAYAPRDMDNSGSPDYIYPDSFYTLYAKTHQHLVSLGLDTTVILVGNDISAGDDPMTDIGTTLSAWSGGNRCDHYIGATSFHSYGQIYGPGGLCARVKNQVYGNDFDGTYEPILMGEIGDHSGEHATTESMINNSFDCAKKIVAEAKQGAYAIARWGYNNLGGGFDATLGYGEKPLVQNFNAMQLFASSVPRLKTDHYVMKTLVASSGGYLDAVDIRFWHPGLLRNADAIWVVNVSANPREVLFVISNSPEDKIFYRKQIDLLDTCCVIESGKKIKAPVTNPRFVDTLPPKSLVVYSEYFSLVGIESEKKHREERCTAVVFATPNPFIQKTVIQFRVRSSQPEADKPLAQEFADRSLLLHIHDSSGRLVRSLQISRSPNHQISKSYWDGTDALGEEVGPGVYFCKLISGNFKAEGKVVRIK